MSEHLIPDVCDEVHGLNDARKLGIAGYSGAIRVTVIADGDWVRLSKGVSDDGPAGLTPAQARYLADKLYYMAALVEQRQSKPKESKP